MLTFDMARACHYVAKTKKQCLLLGQKLTWPLIFLSGHDDESSAVISRSAPKQCVRANTTNPRHPSLSQDPPNTSCTSNRVGGVCWHRQRQSHHHWRIGQFFLLPSLCSCSHPFPSKGAAGSDSNISKRHCQHIAALLASCCHCRLHDG